MLSQKKYVFCKILWQILIFDKLLLTTARKEKFYIPDTLVVFHDDHSITNFYNSNVLIPITSMAEPDKFMLANALKWYIDALSAKTALYYFWSYQLLFVI